MAGKTIALIGALDTKGVEYGFLRDAIEARGHNVLLIDVGILESPVINPDETRERVAEAAGIDLKSLIRERDRGRSVAAMSEGAAVLLPQLYAEGKFDAVMAMGGTGGTSVACGAMRALPLGVPKVMVSTAAGTDVSGYVGVKDIVMIPSIVDVAGINKISRRIFMQAAGAICGMVETEVSEGTEKPLIAATMFGNTTQAVNYAREILEYAGYEVLVFHCTGTGGLTMENLIESGQVEGVLDMTTTEWADEIAGGIFSSGPTRLEAAAKSGVPAIIAPGCLDMVNWGAPDTVPEEYKDRKFYQHNPNITLMRTTVEECCMLGKVMAEKLNQSTAAVTVLLPLKGFSMIDLEGKDFYLPEANIAFCETLKSNLYEDIKVVEMDCEINDSAFAVRCAEELLLNLK
ncbi:MAG: hypothetical protein DF168_00241 [Candidatus Moanabacter tarae]|uniref:Uncharacterized protein n=1 Tax=Candidatus Moanibacter tarae TaxID=2200854 RepID=A0A2Z4AGI6_9BACT|nr:MAG: hypothetical protein DF168_00241 [Candidatus Moanabacter tarae]|tara:strand:+ start:4929 stop:6137 length:1209 start_codon:yes stop_codon:yes gene_type:complete